MPKHKTVNAGKKTVLQILSLSESWDFILIKYDVCNEAETNQDPSGVNDIKNTI